MSLPSTDPSKPWDNSAQMLNVLVSTWEFIKDIWEESDSGDVLDHIYGIKYLWMIDYVTSTMNLPNPLKVELKESKKRYKQRNKAAKKDKASKCESCGCVKD